MGKEPGYVIGICCNTFYRKKETGSTGMAILDIGILTGFKLDEKSHEKVSQRR